MKKLLVFTFTLALASPAAAFDLGGGGGMGTHHSASSGGESGSSAGAPGTNSLGTALSSGRDGRRMKGPSLGTGNPFVDRDDKRVARVVHSICRGC